MTDQPLLTRQQRDLTRAFDHISTLHAEEQDKKVRDLYGSLCHGFPILVRTNGLCQTLAFFDDKRRAGKEQRQADADNHRRIAYNAIWAHIADVLGVKDEAKLLDHVRKAPVAEYLRDTHRIMEAWVYYKRFAASILGVTADKEVPE